MKALFFNELRRGRLLPVFGLVLGVMVVIVRGLFGIYPPLLTKAMISDSDLLAMLWAVLLLMALLGGAGLFASEVERGTLPLLLSLPLSRFRIWLAKVLAGLALAFCGSAMLALLGLSALPEAVQGSVAREAILSLPLWWSVVFSAAVFFSTILDHAVSAITASVLFCFALFAFVAVGMVTAWGGSFVGGMDILDATLWAVTMAPGLLLGSLIALSRGELLRSKRKWMLGASCFLLCGGALVLLVAISVRWATRYERGRVEAIEPVALSANGAVAAVRAYRWPVWLQDAARRPWDHRSKHLVLVDLASGRELLTSRRGRLAAISADGRLAALAGQRFLLTWSSRTFQSGISHLDIQDLKARRIIYRGWPRRFRGYRAESVSWSPDASWIAFDARPDARLLLMRPGAHDTREIRLWPGWTGYYLDTPLRAWAWDSSGGVFALTPVSFEGPRASESGRLVHYLSTGESIQLWDARSVPLPGDYDWLGAEVSASPDGGWVAADLVAAHYERRWGPGSRPQQTKALVFVFVISADGKRSLLLSRTVLQGEFGRLDYAWSKDGARLYYLIQSRGLEAVELRLWRRGEPQAIALPIPAERLAERIALPRKGTDVLVWTGLGPYLVNSKGQARSLPWPREPRLAGQGSFLGLDDRDQAVISPQTPRGRVLGVVDLDTGNFKQVYP